MTWRDDRVPPAATSTTADAWAATYWTPRPELLNGADSDQQLGEILYTTTAAGVAPIWAANSGGAALTQNARTGIWVVAQMRTQATVNAVLILKRYPFDTQLLSVQIESSTSQAFDVVFIPTPGCGAGFKPRGGIDGWNISESSAVSSLHVYATFGETFSQLTRRDAAERAAGAALCLGSDLPRRYGGPRSLCAGGRAGSPRLRAVLLPWYRFVAVHPRLVDAELGLLDAP